MFKMCVLKGSRTYSGYLVLNRTCCSLHQPRLDWIRVAVRQHYQSYLSKMDESNWCQSKVNVAKAELEWQIDNFCDSFDLMGDYMSSDTFFTSSAPEIKWRMFLGSCVQVRQDPRVGGQSLQIPVSLQLVASNKHLVKAMFRVSLYSSTGSYLTSEGSKLAVTFRLFARESVNCVIGKSWVLNKLPAGALIIRCQVRFCLNTETVSGRIHPLQLDHRHSLAGDLGQLLEKEELTDVHICVQGHTFAAHRTILAGRSPVFRAMFRHEMVENVESRVQIVDFQAPVIQELLLFIYTDTTPNLKTKVRDLLACAEKYQLDTLKQRCELELATQLTTQNVNELLVLSHLHRADRLLTRILEFVARHGDSIMLTPECKDLINISAEGNQQKVLSADRYSEPQMPPHKKAKTDKSLAVS